MDQEKRASDVFGRLFTPANVLFVLVFAIVAGLLVAIVFAGASCNALGGIDLARFDAKTTGRMVNVVCIGSQDGLLAVFFAGVVGFVIGFLAGAIAGGLLTLASAVVKAAVDRLGRAAAAGLSIGKRAGLGIPFREPKPLTCDEAKRRLAEAQEELRQAIAERDAQLAVVAEADRRVAIALAALSVLAAALAAALPFAWLDPVGVMAVAAAVVAAVVLLSTLILAAAQARAKLIELEGIVATLQGTVKDREETVALTCGVDVAVSVSGPTVGPVGLTT